MILRASSDWCWAVSIVINDNYFLMMAKSAIHTALNPRERPKSSDSRESDSCKQHMLRASSQLHINTCQRSTWQQQRPPNKNDISIYHFKNYSCSVSMIIIILINAKGHYITLNYLLINTRRRATIIFNNHIHSNDVYSMISISLTIAHATVNQYSAISNAIH